MRVLRAGVGTSGRETRSVRDTDQVLRRVWKPFPANQQPATVLPLMPRRAPEAIESGVTSPLEGPV